MLRRTRIELSAAVFLGLLALTFGLIVPYATNPDGVTEYSKAKEELLEIEKRVNGSKGGWENEGVMIRFTLASQRGAIAAMKDSTDGARRRTGLVGGALLFLSFLLLIGSYIIADLVSVKWQHKMEGGAIIVLALMGVVLVVVAGLIFLSVLLARAPGYIHL